MEKALGSIAKSGSGPIVDVIGPGERVRRKGLVFAATPASDFVCGTLQLAAGMNLQVFTTGRGHALRPVDGAGGEGFLIPALSDRWRRPDRPRRRAASPRGEATIADVGWELFRLILDVASGRKRVAADRLGLHNDLVLFNPAPVT